MDIDILLWGDRQIQDDRLTVPHRDLHQRAFVLSPLLHLDPGLAIPGHDGRTVLDYARKLDQHIPLWMGIVNLTPDSFSDGGTFTNWQAVSDSVEQMVEHGVHMIDLGAESTRPGASPLDAEEEWARLAPVLERLVSRFDGDRLAPRLSVDTRHVSVAEKAVDMGADMINDVSGLTSPDMVALARQLNRDWIAMHHLSIPTRNDHRLPDDCDPVKEVTGWFQERLDEWDRAGLDPGRIIIDPGIGFGKNSLHSLQLLRHIDALQDLGMRVLAGHSRKSFMQAYTEIPPAYRDLETIGASLKLAQKGVDILRVHDVPGHVRAYTAWAHLEPY